MNVLKFQSKSCKSARLGAHKRSFFLGDGSLSAPPGSLPIRMRDCARWRAFRALSFSACVFVSGGHFEPCGLPLPVPTSGERSSVVEFFWAALMITPRERYSGISFRHTTMRGRRGATSPASGSRRVFEYDFPPFPRSPLHFWALQLNTAARIRGKIPH